MGKKKHSKKTRAAAPSADANHTIPVRASWLDADGSAPPPLPVIAGPPALPTLPRRDTMEVKGEWLEGTVPPPPPPLPPPPALPDMTPAKARGRKPKAVAREEPDE